MSYLVSHYEDKLGLTEMGKQRSLSSTGNFLFKSYFFIVNLKILTPFISRFEFYLSNDIFLLTISTVTGKSAAKYSG